MADQRVYPNDQSFINLYNKLIKEGKTVNDIAKEAGYSDPASVRRRKRNIVKRTGDETLFYDPENMREMFANTLPDKSNEFTPVHLPDEELDAETLVEKRIEEYTKKAEALEARKLIPVKVNVKGPFGITFFGDPHVDDDGCNIALLKKHTDMVVATEGMMAVNIGDTTNNWIGRLSRLWGEQGTSQNQAAILAEWFINRLPWLCILLGNHDLWTGGKRRNLISWIYRHSQYNGGVLEDWRARLKLQAPNGREIILNCAHDFPGHSMWHALHGPLKHSKMAYPDDDILVCGHKHTSAYGWYCGESRLTHMIRVGGYKRYDSHSDKLGFPVLDAPAAQTAIIDPEASDHCLITVFADPMEAREYLAFKRSRGK
ncbi:MAG: hypothetical protein GTN99_02960, partial [Candidatus Dadabacteria bacterium]|nr:hypothetical protein [Candidatus Dadabacteria bacterium]